MRWVVVGWVWLLAVGASAQGLESDAPRSAVSRYEIGKALYRKGDYAGAAAEFKAALAIYASPKLAYSCAERAGQVDDAIRAYERYLELAPKATDRGEVDALLGSLRERQQKSLSSVAIVTRPAGAAIFVDGAEKAEAKTTPTTIRLPAGAHTLRFTVEGYQPHDQTLQVLQGKSATVEADLEPATKAVAPAPEPASPPPTGASPLRVAGWTALGLGIVGAGVGTWFALDANDAAESATGKTGSDREDLKDRYETGQTVGGVGLGVGGALLVTGVVLLLLPDGEASAAVHPGGGAIAWRF